MIKRAVATNDRDIQYECPECGNDMGGSNYTYMIVCSKCNKLVRVREGTFGGTLEK